MRKGSRWIARQVLALIVVGLCALFGFRGQRPVQSAAAEPAAGPPTAGPSAGRPSLRGAEAVAQLKQAGSYDALAAAVEASRYGVAPLPGGAYRADNPAQQYRAEFTAGGVALRSLDKDRGWRLG